MDAFTFFKELRPLGGNPHPADSSLWHGFEQATYEAKKELDSLWADYTRRYASTGSPSDVLALILEARLKRLDVIAEWMLRIFVAEEETARLYEEWLADLMRAEEKNVLDLVHEEMPHYGEYFNHEEFTHTLLLRQQSYKEKCDSKVIQLIRERRAANADAPTRTEPSISPEHLATASTTDRKERRSAWLNRQFVGGASWTSDLEITQAGGPAYNTIQRYRSGRKSTRDLYVRRSLARVFNCDVTDVPE